MKFEMEDGTSRVGKFYRAGRWTREAILEEHEFLQDLVNAEIPVVAPLIPLGTDSDGLFFAVFPKARGRAPEELNNDQARMLGRLVARMHGVGETKKTAHRLKLTPENFGLKPLEFLLKGNWIAIEVQTRYEKVTRDLVNFITPLFQGLKTHRIHGDCHLGNLLFDTGGKAFFLDFDDMVEGPAVQDIWLATPTYHEEGQQIRENFISGYEEMRKFDRDTLKLIEPLRALRIINYSAWIARRWEDPFFQRIFTEFRSYKYWAQEVEGLELLLRTIQL